jgi:hypothetical protein
VAKDYSVGQDKTQTSHLHTSNLIQVPFLPDWLRAEYQNRLQPQTALIDCPQIGKMALDYSLKLLIISFMRFIALLPSSDCRNFSPPKKRDMANSISSLRLCMLLVF